LLSKAYCHFGARVIPAPNGTRLASLQNHVAAEDGRQLGLCLREKSNEGE